MGTHRDDLAALGWQLVDRPESATITNDHGVWFSFTGARFGDFHTGHVLSAVGNAAYRHYFLQADTAGLPEFFRRFDAAVRTVMPDDRDGWTSKITTRLFRLDVTMDQVVADLTGKGWTYDVANSVVGLTNDAGCATTLNGYADDAFAVLQLTTADTADLASTRVYGTHLPQDQLGQALSTIDAGARAMTPKKRDAWLKAMAKDLGIRIRWTRSRGKSVIFSDS